MNRYAFGMLLTVVIASSIVVGILAVDAYASSNRGYDNKWPDNQLPTPEYVRDYTIYYLRENEAIVLPDPSVWSGGNVTPDGLLGYSTYIYKSGSIVVTVGFPIVLPENTIFDVKVENQGTIVWQGHIYQGQFS